MAEQISCFDRLTKACGGTYTIGVRVLMAKKLSTTGDPQLFM